MQVQPKSPALYIWQPQSTLRFGDAVVEEVTITSFTKTGGILPETAAGRIVFKDGPVNLQWTGEHHGGQFGYWRFKCYQITGNGGSMVANEIAWPTRLDSIFCKMIQDYDAIPQPVPAGRGWKQVA
jgi:hypothetical protein